MQILAKILVPTVIHKLYDKENNPMTRFYMANARTIHSWKMTFQSVNIDVIKHLNSVLGRQNSVW